MLTRRRFLSLSGAGFAAVSSFPAMARPVETIGGSAFGSYWRLTLPGGASTEAAGTAIAQVIETIDALFSPYRETSEIGRFNAVASTERQPVSEPCRVVVDAALAIARQSNGAFDPAVGPHVARYGFGPLADARPGIHTQFSLDDEGLRKDEARLSLDLCGIAKGRALDVASSALEALGLEDYLVDFGGELLARGMHPAGRDWQVAIDDPLLGNPRHILSLRNRAAATSGLAAQSYRIGGRTIGHIIDPRTGAPIESKTLSVTVLGHDGMHADAWATALMALPHDQAIALAHAHDLDALLLLRDGDTLNSAITGNFVDHLLG